MAWLQRLFGLEKKQVPQAQTAPAPKAQEIPPERMGLNGEYDQNGLAKRVTLAFDQDPRIDDVDTVYIAQKGGAVVLKGKAPNQQFLSQMVSVARGVSGATGVETDQVAVG